MTTIGPAAAPRRRSKIVWPDVASAEDMVRAVDEAVLAMDGFARGDVVVIVAGAPPHAVGVTDLLRVRRLGDDIA